MQFASDNTSGVAPEILAAIADAADGFAPSYATDDLSDALDERFSDLFETSVRVFPVISGTAANALALGGMTAPHGLLYSHVDAHIAVDEAGAPEFYSYGARLVGLPGAGGRIDPDAFESAVNRPGHGVHASVPSAVSLTQATEAGTVYPLDDVAALAAAVG